MALIIVLAFVLLLAGLTVAYFSQTTTDRQIAQTSFSEASADQIASSATAIILGDLRQEIIRGSASPAPTFGPSPTASPYYLYTPTSPNYMVPQRSGTPSAGAIPNLVRRSVRSDPIPAPGLPSRASAVNSVSDASANGRAVTLPRWNKHYLIPKLNTAPGDDTTDPVTSFVAPDWVMLTGEEGAVVLSTPKTDSNGTAVTPLGRYAYAVYDEGGLLDLNVAGYPNDPSTAPIPAIRVGRKGSTAFADLTALGSYSLPNSSVPHQVDRIVGWRNFGTTQPTNNFPDTSPEFAANFQTSSTPAANYFNVVVNNANGFLRGRGDPSPSPTPWPRPATPPYPNPSPTYPPSNNRTDQMFLNRQQLLAFRQTTQFSSNTMQYLSTFSRESNSPSLSPSTPVGSTIDYATLASTATAVNPNFLMRRMRPQSSTPYTRFDGTPAVEGEPLIKTRFPLSRLTWVTYKGPSANLQICKDVDGTINTNCTSDQVIRDLVSSGVPVSTLRAGTAANIKRCFGLVWDSRTPYSPQSGTTPSVGQQWVYTSPASTNGGGTFDPNNSGLTPPYGTPASTIKRLDIVALENREPDFFELLRATILDGSIGQNTGGGVTGGTAVFPDVHMSNKDHHILSIGAAIIDQADPDSIPTRIQFKPPAATGANWWTAYGVESLPYITQIYPISGISPATSTQWATYLLFQLANPHNNNGVVLSPPAPQVRLRVDGGIGLFTGGNGQTYATATDKQTSLFTGGSTGQSIAFTVGVFPPSATPSPVATPGVSTYPAVGSTSPPGGFERLPTSSTGTPINPYVGLRILPDHTLVGAASGNNPQVTLYLGTDSTHQFNATMEYNVSGTSNWVPYNHFIGINDPSSWMNGATLPVRTASSRSPATPSSTVDQFNTGRLTQSPPSSLMKADPRATRFGIFQLNSNITSAARLTEPFWPSGASTPTTVSGYGGLIYPSNPLGIVEHVPLRFDSATLPYYPATFARNTAPSSATVTSYADPDGVVRPADAAYPDPANSTAGSSTPYYTPSKMYWPIMLNRPFRSVAELGYAFRDLPWKSLDFFTDKSADAGLLDVFCINDGTPVYDASSNIVGLATPSMVAGLVNLNTPQAPPLQAILAGTIWDELTPANSYPKATSAADSAQTMAPLVVSATTTAPLQNRSELISRTASPTLPNQVLPVYSGTTANVTDQLVKAQREAVPRALASVGQTRTWNLMIDVIAQSGTYPPGENNLANFVVQSEQRYWVHVAIDRFTGQVIDKQIEVVNE
jgi:hypothetical protein